jgi:hypothetical protein
MDHDMRVEQARGLGANQSRGLKGSNQVREPMQIYLQISSSNQVIVERLRTIVERLTIANDFLGGHPAEESSNGLNGSTLTTAGWLESTAFQQSLATDLLDEIDRQLLRLP